MTAKKTTTKVPKRKPKSIWHTLSVINVNEYTEVKGSGGFTATYLSWSWAWGILMEHYPDATFTNHTNDDGYPCFFDHNGFAMVRVTLWIEEKSHTEDFMVTDHSNRAIKNPDSFAINTALKRCLVKCMAYYGLGHYLYSGEDLPREEAEAVKEAEAVEEAAREESGATPKQVAAVRELLKKSDDPVEATKRTLAWAGLKKTDSISKISSEKATKLLQAKK